VPVLGVARVPHVDVILGILAREIDNMGRFAKIGGACHAGEAIGHMKTTQIMHILISKLFNSVQK
jgi:hypothetical protein